MSHNRDVYPTVISLVILCYVTLFTLAWPKFDGANICNSHLPCPHAPGIHASCLSSLLSHLFLSESGPPGPLRPPSHVFKLCVPFFLFTSLNLTQLLLVHSYSVSALLLTLLAKNKNLVKLFSEVILHVFCVSV